jgi:hypothetical protein
VQHGYHVRRISVGARAAKPRSRLEYLSSIGVAHPAIVAQATDSDQSYRGLIPEPRWTVSGRSCWNWPYVAMGGEDRGRRRGQPGKVVCGRVAWQGATL